MNREEINPYFATRFKRDKKFRNGSFFQGGENYIALTFWTGSDYMHRTPNIYFEIHEKNGITTWMIGRDNPEKAEYFEKLSSELHGWKKGRNKGTFYKKYDNTIDNYQSHLNDFLSNDKLLIDEYIKISMDRIGEESESLFEDEYTSKFGFISNEQFEIMVTNVLQFNQVERRKKVIQAILDEGNTTEVSENLPLSLDSIAIVNYHQFSDTTIQDLPSEANWIFLTGNNGYGKTSVLQAIALGLTNYKENVAKLGDDDKIRIGYKLNDETVVNSSVFSREPEFDALNDKVVAYGPSRLNTIAAESRNKGSKGFSQIEGLFDSTSLLASVDYELARAFNSDKNYFNMLRDMIRGITKNQISDILVDSELSVKYVAGDVNDKPLKIEELSAGYRSIINLACDIVTRLFDKDKHTNFGGIVGIVIIDELENHLHPILQRELPKALSEVFTKIQFIVSTHSPIPLLGIKTRPIVLNVQNDLSRGLYLRRLVEIERSYEQLLPNTILTSPLFDFHQIISEGYVKKDRLATEDSFEEFIEKKEIKANLKLIAEKIRRKKNEED